MKQEEAKLEYAKIKLDETKSAQAHNERKADLERDHYEERREMSARHEEERREMSARQEIERRDLADRQEQERKNLRTVWHRSLVSFAERVVALRQKAADEGIELDADAEK